jgi:hypothetical protein
MIKTEIELTEQQNLALQTLASQLGKEPIELIGQAISNLLANWDQKTRLQKMRVARGIWKDREDLPNFDELRHSWQRSSLNLDE